MSDKSVSPQLENGYTKIANEIMDALIFHRLSGQEYQVTLYIIRKTYGFNKVSDFISMGQIAKATGINRPKIAMLIKTLISKNIIGVLPKKITGVTKNGNNGINCLFFSKDYTKWQVLPKKITVTKKDNKLLPKKITGVLPKMVHTKESIKESIKESKEIYKESIFEIVSYLNQILGTNYKSSSIETVRVIRVRLEKGFTVDNFKTVIDKKYAEWGSDEKMCKFLRPETLFGTKFEGYLNQPSQMPKVSKSMQNIRDYMKRTGVQNDEGRGIEDCIEISGRFSGS